jgi:hypothetical protein
MPDDRCPLCLRQRRNCSCRPDDVYGPEPYRSAKPQPGPGVVREKYEDLQRQNAELRKALRESEVYLETARTERDTALQRISALELEAEER